MGAAAGAAEQLAQIFFRSRARAPEFRALEGLQQKYYIHDPETGEYGGFYVWRSADDVRAYRESELAASIASAYQVIGKPEVTVYEILMPLRG